MYKILIIEDDGTIAEGLKKHLEKWDYQVECVTDFKNVMDSFLKFEPQLVLLDLVLPFFNGFHWCQEIRKVSKVPVLFISSANESMNIVMAMNMGGDEFIEKPFDLNVVTAKVQAVLRRTYEFQGSVDVMQWHGAYLNLADATIEYEQNKMELTKNKHVLSWIDRQAALTKPDQIIWIDGSEEQLEALRAEGCSTGELYKLNQEKLPGCYLHRSDPTDVARVESRTFICCKKQEDAGPTNNWMDPAEAYEMLYGKKVTPVTKKHTAV